MKLKSPMGEKIHDEIIADINSYMQKKDTIPPTEEIQHLIYKKYKECDDVLEMFISCSEQEALNWACSESMVYSQNYREPDRPTCPKNVYSRCTVSSNFKCSICLEDDNKIKTIRVDICECFFHETCFIESYKFSQSCPVCRMKIVPVNIYKDPVLEIIV